MIIEMSKGYQISIPAKIRNELGWKPRTKLIIEQQGKEARIKPLAERNDSWESLFARGKNYKTKLTPEELDKLMWDDNELL